MRIRIFIDFWNFQIEWNNYHNKHGASSPVKIPWETLLAKEICRTIDPSAVYAGTRVFASTDPKKASDNGLRRFLHAMDGFPGYKVILKERQPASRIRCPECENHIDVCPHCRKPLRRTIEKGIDTSIVTDLITMSLDSLHDRAVLVSADADMIPAVEYLQGKGKEVSHFYFRPLGEALRNSC